jgi:hypothetical protein
VVAERPDHRLCATEAMDMRPKMGHVENLVLRSRERNVDRSIGASLSNSSVRPLTLCGVNSSATARDYEMIARRTVAGYRQAPGSLTSAR